MAYKNCHVCTNAKRIRHRVRKLDELKKPKGICPKCGGEQEVKAIGKGKFKGFNWYLWRKTCKNPKCSFIWESKRYKLDVITYE